MGSKRRLAKDLIPILTKELKEDTYYVEPFVGGANLIDKIDHARKIGGDSNKYLIALLKYVQAGSILPTYITKEEYISVKENKNNFPDWYVGFVGFVCSYRGIFFSSYINNNIKKKNGRIENYQTEQINNLARQNFKNIEFYCSSYDNLFIPDYSIIYCDPPYRNTVSYEEEFNHNKFWDWVREMTIRGHKVFVSEYNAPKDFKCIWNKQQTKNLGSKQQSTIEKLFIYGR